MKRPFEFSLGIFLFQVVYLMMNVTGIENKYRFYWISPYRVVEIARRRQMGTL